MGEEGPKVWYRDANWLLLYALLLFVPFGCAAGWLAFAAPEPSHMFLAVQLGLIVSIGGTDRFLRVRTDDPDGEDQIEARVAGVERVRRGSWWRLRRAPSSTPPASFRASARAPDPLEAWADQGVLRAPWRSKSVLAGSLTMIVGFIGMVTLPLLFDWAKRSPSGLAWYAALLVALVATMFFVGWRNVRGSVVRADRFELGFGETIRRADVLSVEEQATSITVAHRFSGAETRTELLPSGLSGSRVKDEMAFALARAVLESPEAADTRASRFAELTEAEAHASMLADVEAEAEAEAAARVAKVRSRRRRPTE